MKAGDVVNVSAPFSRLFPPDGVAVVRWVFPGGDVWLQERFAGISKPFDADGGPNFAASMVTATALVEDDIAGWANGAEIERNINSIKSLGSLAAVTLVASTAAQNASALRLAYAAATKLEAIMMGDYLSILTDTQLQNAFGLTPTQVTNLRVNKLTPAANTASAIRAAIGA
jgi:hypothetical protein